MERVVVYSSYCIGEIIGGSYIGSKRWLIGEICWLCREKGWLIGEICWLCREKGWLIGKICWLCREIGWLIGKICWLVGRYGDSLGICTGSLAKLGRPIRPR